MGVDRGGEEEGKGFSAIVTSSAMVMKTALWIDQKGIVKVKHLALEIESSLRSRAQICFVLCFNPKCRTSCDAECCQHLMLLIMINATSLWKCYLTC